MNPSQLIQELVSAVLAWEEADAKRARLLDSKSAKKTEVDVANHNLVVAIKRLRAVSRELRKVVSGKSKLRKPINWGKIINAVAKTMTLVNGVVQQQQQQQGELPPGINPAKVIDME